jgi:hypothetical protein
MLMGTLYRFSCPGCGYSATVSGGDDSGFVYATRTVVCDRCAIVADVVSSDTPWNPATVASYCALRCPLCDGLVHPWHDRKCPKCGSVMEPEEGIAIPWD